MILYDDNEMVVNVPDFLINEENEISEENEVS